MVREDIHNTKELLSRKADRYISQLFAEDQEDVKHFINDLLADGFSASRVLKMLSTLSSIRKRLNKPFKNVTTDELKAFSAELERSNYAEWTKHDMRVILRKFLVATGKGKEIAWLKIKTVKNGKLPEEVLTEMDIKGLAGASYTKRDSAFILSFYESGCRIGEFLPLKLKHVSFDKHGAVLRVTGKTGDRRIRLVASILTLQSLINEHPQKNDPEAYIWCKIPTRYNPKFKNDHLSYGFICRLLNELAQKADIKKAVNPHSFRHSRATFMASHLKEPAMREFFGWGKDSEMPATYVHLSGRDIDEAVLSMYGVAEAKKASEPIIRPWGCPRCQEANEPAAKYCKKCGLPVDAMSGDKIEGLLIEFLKIIGDAFPQVKDKFREVVKDRGAEGLFKV